MANGGGGGMGRILGVGFLFGAKEDGVLETTEEISQSMEGVKRSAEDAGREGSDGLRRFGNAINSLNFLRLGDISSTLDQIAERAGLGAGAQSTAMEQFGAQYAQTFRQATAGMGEFSAGMERVRGQVSSAAFNLQVDAGQILEAIRPVARMGDDIEDFGISIRGLAGGIQAGFIQGQQFGNMLRELRSNYQLTAEQTGNLVDRVTVLGERFGVGAEAVGTLPTVLEALRPVAARFPGIAGNIDSAVESVTRLALAQQAVTGVPFAEAVQGATTVLSELAGARGEVQRTLVGLGDDLGELTTELGVASGDIGGAFDAIMEDPFRFAQQVAGMMQTARPDLQVRLREILQSMGPTFVRLVDGSDEASEALRRAAESTGDASGALENMARASSGSTRTFQENLDMMRDAFETRMNSIGRATDRNFVSRQRRAYQRVGDTIQEFAGREGPLGALTRGFLRVRTFGLVQGLLPQLGVLGEGLGEAAGQAGPFIRAMGDVGILGALRNAATGTGLFGRSLRGLWGVFSRFLGPVAIIAGAGYLIYRNWERLPDLFNSIGRYVLQGATWFRDMGERFANWTAQIDWPLVGTRIANGLIGIVQAITGGDGGEVGSALGQGFVNLFRGLGRIIPGIARGLWERFMEGFSGAGGGIGQWIQRSFSLYFQWIGFFWSRVSDLFERGSGWFRQIVAVLGPFIQHVREGVAYLSEVFGAIWQDAQPYIADVFFQMEEMFGMIMDTIDDVVIPLINDFVDIWQGQVGEYVFGDGKEGFRELGEAAETMWTGTLRPLLRSFAYSWATAFGNMMRIGLEMFRRVSIAGHTAITRVRSWIDQIGIVWETVVNVAGAGWGALRAITEEVWGRTMNFIEGAFDEVVYGWRILVAGFRSTILSIIGGVVESITDLFNRLPESFITMLGRVSPEAASVVEDLQASMADINRQITEAATTARTTRTEIEQERQRTRRERAAESAALTRRREIAVGTTLGAAVEGGRRVMQRRAEEEAAIEAFNTVINRTVGRLQEANSALQRRMQEFARRDPRAAREARDAAQRIAAAEEVLEAVRGAAGRGGVLSRGQAEQLAETITRRALSGELSQSELRELRGRLREAGDIEGRGAGGRRRAAVQGLMAMAAGEEPAETRRREARGRQRRRLEGAEEAAGGAPAAAAGPTEVVVVGHSPRARQETREDTSVTMVGNPFGGGEPSAAAGAP